MLRGRAAEQALVALGQWFCSYLAVLCLLPGAQKVSESLVQPHLCCEMAERILMMRQPIFLVLA